MGDTFYEADTSEEAIRRYLKANDTLYDKIKNGIIEDILSSLIDFSKSIKVLEVGTGGVSGLNFLSNKVLMLPVLIYADKS